MNSFTYSDSDFAKYLNDFTYTDFTFEECLNTFAYTRLGFEHPMNTFTYTDASFSKNPLFSMKTASRSAKASPYSASSASTSAIPTSARLRVASIAGKDRSSCCRPSCMCARPCASRGATEERSPRREPWVKRTKANQAHGWGERDFLTFFPRCERAAEGRRSPRRWTRFPLANKCAKQSWTAPALWRFICRCSCANLFPAGRRRGQRRRGAASSRNRGCDICGRLPPKLRRWPSPDTPIFEFPTKNQITQMKVKVLRMQVKVQQIQLATNL